MREGVSLEDVQTGNFEYGNVMIGEEDWAALGVDVDAPIVVDWEVADEDSYNDMFAQIPPDEVLQMIAELELEFYPSWPGEEEDSPTLP